MKIVAISRRRRTWLRFKDRKAWRPPVGRIVCVSRQCVIVLASVRFLRLVTNQKHAQLDALKHRRETTVRTNEVHVLPTGVKKVVLDLFALDREPSDAATFSHVFGWILSLQSFQSFSFCARTLPSFSNSVVVFCTRTWLCHWRCQCGEGLVDMLSTLQHIYVVFAVGRTIFIAWFSRLWLKHQCCQQVLGKLEGYGVFLFFLVDSNAISWFTNVHRKTSHMFQLSVFFLQNES